MTDGDRTRDNRNHNPGLYQLSYGHHIVKLRIVELVRPAGLEPATLALEGRCSIQLSYGRSFEPRVLSEKESKSEIWSEWRDSNPRPPVPKTGALARLRYTPRYRLKHIQISL